jgi:NAD(P)-dependent dehydrogenase (short-subunit alcohol dehydrogenase family)
MAIEFAAEGISDLILWDIRMDLLEETKGLVLSDIRVYKNNRGLGGEGGKSQISGNGEGGSLRVLLQQCDLSKREAIYKTADETLTHYPDGIDVLVNNAGIVSGKVRNWENERAILASFIFSLRLCCSSCSCSRSSSYSSSSSYHYSSFTFQSLS